MVLDEDRVPSICYVIDNGLQSVLACATMKTPAQAPDPTVRVSKDGHRITLTEYEVRTLDLYGDSIQVLHFPTREAALAAAPHEIGKDGCMAVAVEKHVSKRPAFLASEPDKYTVIATFGDRKALEEGGWIQ